MIIRCIDLRGEKEFRGAIELMCSRMVAREAAWKILGSSRRVIRRVFDGGAGDESGGRELRSMERGERERFCNIEGEEPAEFGGELRWRLEVWRAERLPRSTSVMVVIYGDA